MSAIGDVIDQIAASGTTKLVDIAAALNKRGVARPTGKSWAAPAVAKILLAHKLDQARARRQQ